MMKEKIILVRFLLALFVGVIFIDSSAALAQSGTQTAQPTGTSTTTTTPPTTTSAPANPNANAPAPATATTNPVAVPANSTPSAPATNVTSSDPAKIAPVDASAANASVKKVGSVVLPPEKAAPVRLVKFATPPVIDGKLDDEVWKTAAVFKDFYQIDPGDNTPPTKPTEVYVGYDAKTLYVAFKAYDEPDKVRATVPRRDNIFNDDYIGMFMDTFNDKRRAYIMFFSPLGVQADGILTEGRGEDYSVDIVMDSKGALNETGYVVEVAIPFKSLRYEAGKGKQWGIHWLRRVKRLNNELDSWMPFSRDVQGNLNQAGHITGLEDISTERTFEIIPSLTVSQTGKRTGAFAQPGPDRLVNQPVTLEPGFTAKLGLTPQITLDMAVNPDFAQVEADSLVNTANLRFPIFFAERRPFFLEGIDIFQTRMNIVHTRAIVDPDAAFKISGKHGKNTFGLILASDNGPGNFIGDDRLNPFNNPFIDKNAHIGVLRLKRDIGKESSLGLIATTYNFIQKHNDVFGFDGRIKSSPKIVTEFQVVGTTSRNYFFNPDANACTNVTTGATSASSVFGCSDYRTGNSFGYNFFSSYSGRNLAIELYASGRTRDYRTDVGFVQRTNTNQNAYFVGWFSDPKEKATIKSWSLTNFSHVNYDFQGRMQVWESEVHYQLNFPKQSWFHVGYERGYERLLEEEFGRTRTDTRAGRFFEHSERASDKNHFFVNGGRTISKRYQFDAFMTYRMGHFDLDFGGGRKFPRVSPGSLVNPNQLDPGRGNQLEMGGNFAWQPTSAIRSTVNFNHLNLKRHDTGKVAFADNLISSRTTYQFTKFLFARARFDYSTRTTNLRSQMLVGYTPNPGTAFYAGYNDDVFYGFNPISRLADPGFTRRERQFFIKMAYLFRRSF